MTTQKVTVSTPHRLLLVVLLTFFIHASFIPNGFTWLDQNDILEKNAVLPIHQIHRAFMIPFGQTSFYRPVVTIVNSIDAFLYQEWAPGFHLTNVLLHLIVVALVPLFLSVYFKLSKHHAYLGALIVGVHPGSILVVGSITQRQEPLFIIFTILTLYFHKKAREKHTMVSQTLTVLCFLAALFSKETAIVIVPLLIILWEIIHRTKKDVQFFLLELTALAFYIVLRAEAVPTLWGTQAPDLTISQHVGTRFGLFLKWLFLLISPFKPSFSDAVPILDLVTFQSIIAISILILSLVFIVRSGLVSPTSKSLILLFVFLSAGLAIIPVPRIGSPHYIYLPTLGLAALIATIASTMPGRFFKIIMVVWIIVASISVFQTGFQFRDNQSLFTPEVEKDPYFYEGHYYLGNHYLQSGDTDNAEQEFGRGLVENPHVIAFRNKWALLVNLAGIKLENGHLDEAEELYNKAEPETPESMRVYMLYNRGIIAYQKGDYSEVVELLSDKELPTKESYMLLADALSKLNRHEEAEKILRHVTR